MDIYTSELQNKRPFFTDEHVAKFEKNKEGQTLWCFNKILKEHRPASKVFDPIKLIVIKEIIKQTGTYEDKFFSCYFKD